MTFALLTAALMLGACSEVRFDKVPTPPPPPQPPVVPNQVITDEFTVETAKVDLLFVIDNSGSMEAEQAELGNRFPTFLSTLTEIDWQIGFVTTDMDGSGPTKGGNLLEIEGAAPGTKIITPNTPERNKRFKDTVQRSEIGSGDERGIYAAIENVKKHSTHNLYRDKTPMAVVLLSDEDERSNGGEILDYPLEEDRDTPQAFVDTVHSTFNGEKSFSFHSIVISPGDDDCLDEQNQQGLHSYFGNTYAALSNLTDLDTKSIATPGVVGNICGPPSSGQIDYGPQLTQIGDSIRKKLGSRKLGCVPVTGEVEVEFTPADDAINVTLSEDTITFDPPLAGGTKVKLVYPCPPRG
jgi:hypothetical protein